MNIFFFKKKINKVYLKKKKDINRNIYKPKLSYNFWLIFKDNINIYIIFYNKILLENQKKIWEFFEKNFLENILKFQAERKSLVNIQKLPYYEYFRKPKNLDLNIDVIKKEDLKNKLQLKLEKKKIKKFYKKLEKKKFNLYLKK